MLRERGVRVGATYFENPVDDATRLDVRDVAAIDRALDDFARVLGSLDAFVDCTAVAAPQSQHAMDDVDEAAWDAMMAVNTKSSFFAARRAAQLMRNNGGGNIVLIGSIDGVKPAPSPVHYAASKGAIAGMVKAMAKELGPHGIRVNSVAPGVLERGLSRVLPDDLRAEYLKHCGLKRLGRIEEVASLMTWLATENTFVTGQTIVVDGAL